MIKPTSILFRLPSSVDPEQLLFLDGIRHAAEIAELAYRRLQRTLTGIATSNEVATNVDLTTAYLDAWALVDAIDRFRALWKLLPHHEPTPPEQGCRTFDDETQPTRALRNVADHLAQRAKYVVRHRGTALGTLSWFTMTDVKNLAGIACAIIPGTLKDKHDAETHVPAGRTIELPTDHIHLKAGEYTADLSQAFHWMAARVRLIEDAVLKALDEAGFRAEEDSNSDLVLKTPIVFGKSEAEL